MYTKVQEFAPQSQCESVDVFLFPEWQLWQIEVNCKSLLYSSLLSSPLLYLTLLFCLVNTSLFPRTVCPPPLKTNTPLLQHYGVLSWKKYITPSPKRKSQPERHRQTNVYVCKLIYCTVYKHTQERQKETERERAASVYPGTEQTTCLSEQWQEPISLK